MQIVLRIKKLFQSEKSLVAFGIISGVLIHFMKLSNTIYNHDSMVMFYSDSSWLLKQGKWFTNPLTSLKGPFIVRYMAGIIGIVLIVFTCLLLIEIVDIHDEMSKKIVMLLLLASPSVMLCMLYDSMDYFGAVFLLAILSVYIGKGYTRLSWIGATVCLTLSIGAYQGYIGAAAALFLFICIKKLFLSNDDIKCTIKEGMYYISILVSSLILYYIILQISLKVNGVALSSYKGIDNMMSVLHPGALFWSAVKAYKDVIEFFWDDILGGREFYIVWLYRLFILVVLLSILIKIIYLIKNKKYSYAVLSTILIGLMPLAINAVGVLSNNTSFYLITAYPFVLIFVLGYKTVFDLLMKIPYHHIGKVCILGLMAAIIMKMFILTNIQYEKSKYAAEQINAKMIELATIMHSVEGVTKETPVILIGEYPFEFLKLRGVSISYDEFKVKYVEGANQIVLTVNYISSYLENNLSYNFNFMPWEGGFSQEMKEMPIYPEKGSIVLDDQGRLIVKFGSIEAE